MAMRRWLGRLPWGLIGMIGLLGPAEMLAARNSHRFMTWNEFDWKVVGQEARTKAPGADVLVFGDSMLKFGLVPPLLEHRLGRRVYCLALLDGKPAASYFLLRRTLDAGARPKVILVDYQPEMLCEPPDHLMENRHWKGLLSLGECWDFFKTYRDASFFSRTALARLLPSYRLRQGLRESVVLALQSRESENSLENARSGRNREQNQGGLVLAKKPQYHGELPVSYWPVMFRENWSSLPQHTSYIRRLLARAERHGIQVVWVMPPNTPEVERVRRAFGMHERYTAFAQNLQREFPNLRVIDGRAASYPHTLFMDPVHLDRDGAVALSQNVANLLRPILDTESSPIDRWAVLTPPSPAPSQVPVEDLDESKQVVLGSKSTAVR